MSDVIAFLSNLLGAFFEGAGSFAGAPFDPSNKLFLLYILTSLMFAFGVYHATYRRRRSFRSFLRFLAPKRVWRNPSAWLDVRYFFFIGVFSRLFWGGVSVLISVTVYVMLTGSSLDAFIQQATDAPADGSIWVAVLFLVASLIVIDFVSFAMHYLQHTVPVLWEFHKVHHSAEVMHPLSNYREHPVDNILYDCATGLASGLLFAGFSLGFGYIPTPPEVLGASAGSFLFFALGYHLRHSHIWLKWPGVWSKILPSSAHHHVHHSCHPEHIDKNFGFILPLWDVLFRTYVMPETNRDVKFGVPEGRPEGFDSIWGLCVTPFKRALAKLREGPSTERNASSDAPSQAKSAE